VDDPGHCELAPGGILVCRTTDPSWTPLFLVAAGVVIETGGTMSHGAIVARELGVPCVINAQGATRLLPNGGMVTMDGDAGSVEPLT
jgi:pyruvate,water dikinase